MCIVLWLFPYMSRTYVNSPDNFCYIYGEIRFVSQKQNLSAVVKKTYNLYYGCKEGNQDKSRLPHTCCNTCEILRSDAGNLRDVEW